MASIEAIVNKRVVAVARLKKALPGITFRPTKGGAEFQHAEDLETIAAYLERQGQARRKAEPVVEEAPSA